MNTQKADAPASRWHCPECGSRNVLICVPAWFREPPDGAVEFQEVDPGADIVGWECKDCDACAAGAPNEE